MICEVKDGLVPLIVIVSRQKAVGLKKHIQWKYSCYTWLEPSIHTYFFPSFYEGKLYVEINISITAVLYKHNLHQTIMTIMVKKHNSSP